MGGNLVVGIISYFSREAQKAIFSRGCGYMPSFANNSTVERYSTQSPFIRADVKTECENINIYSHGLLSLVSEIAPPFLLQS